MIALKSPTILDFLQRLKLDADIGLLLAILNSCELLANSHPKTMN